MANEPLAIETAREKAEAGGHAPKDAASQGASSLEDSVDGSAQTLLSKSPQKMVAKRLIPLADEVASSDGDIDQLLAGDDLAIKTHSTIDIAGEDGALPFSSIGGVELKRKLGQGGMGAVYLGHHETLAMDVAVKLLLPNGKQHEDRFLQECRLAARIVHPNVVRVFNAGKEHDNLYLVLELVTGGDVSELAKSGGPMPWRRACEIVQQAALGLGAAHQAGVVHRDVKPGNLMIDQAGVVKVADLGLAKTQDIDVEITQTGSIMGTPAYMAPEQAMDVKNAGPAADVYALGVTLYTLISGELPFKGDTSTKVILAHMNDPIPDVRKIVNDIPQELGAYITRLLAKEPADRPQNGDEVAASLKALLESGVTRSNRAAVQTSNVNSADSNKPLLIGAALVVAVIIIALVTSLLPKGETAPAETAASGGDATPPAAAGVSPESEPTVIAPETAATSVAPELDPWQTPARNLFIIHPGGPELEAVLYEGARAAGLRIIERETIDTLIAEQDMTKAGYTNQDEAVKLGKLLGGHIALISEPMDNGSTSVRQVYVETSELVAGPVIISAEDGAAALQSMIQNAASLPAQGMMRFDSVFGQWTVTLGSQHQIMAKDKLAVKATADGIPSLGLKWSPLRAAALRCVALLGLSSTPL